MSDEQRVERVERACMDLQGQIFALHDDLAGTRLIMWGLVVAVMWLGFMVLS